MDSPVRSTYAQIQYLVATPELLVFGIHLDVLDGQGEFRGPGMSVCTSKYVFVLL